MPIDLYQEVTDQIMAMLEQDVVPWRSPILGRGSAGHPKNLESTKPYRGVNVFLLAFTAYAHGYGSSYWLSFKQVQARGGTVKKGEKSSMIVFWKQFEVEDAATGKEKSIPLLRYYRVFNVDQCDGIKAPDAVPFEPTEFEPVEEAEALVRGYEGRPEIEHGGQQAFYRPANDIVRIPEPTRFASAEEYYSTLFHELTHSTGHSKRLGRGLDNNPTPFGSPDYGKEELIAEMGAAFLCGHVGIRPSVIENQACYIQGWLKQLKSDKRLVIGAAAAGQKAADWVRNIRGTSVPVNEAVQAIEVPRG